MEKETKKKAKTETEIESEFGELFIENFVELKEENEKLRKVDNRINISRERILHCSEMIKAYHSSNDPFSKTDINEISIPQLDGMGDWSSSSESLNTGQKDIFCSGALQSNIMQVDGNIEQDNQIRLTSFECESEMLSALINIFRTFNNIWFNSSEHELCKTAKNKTGLRCLFCSFRSFALRLENAKTGHILKPIEIDQLPNEEDNPRKYFSEIIETVGTYDTRFFQFHIWGR